MNLLESGKEIISKIEITELNALIQSSSKIIAITLASVGAIITLLKLLLKQLQVNNHLINDLFQHFSPFEVKNATRYYIPTYGTTQLPTYKDEPYKPEFIKKLTPLYLKRFDNIDENRTNFFFILADIGFGKTTFLINLYRKYKYKRFGKSKYDIILLYLGNKDTDKILKDINHETAKKTILLLDAFDEDFIAIKNFRKRLDELVGIIVKFRAVVITCRTQFFSSEDEEPYKTNFFSPTSNSKIIFFEKNYIICFDKYDIARFLFKKFPPFSFSNIVKLYRSFNYVSNCQSLMVRPMLLGHIEEIINRRDYYKYNFQVYEALLEHWIEREAKKPEILTRYGDSSKFNIYMKEFAQRLAITIFNRHLRGEGISIFKDEHILNSKIQLNDIELIFVSNAEKRNNSFLIRDGAGNYKFSHRSILEYLIAKNHFENRIKIPKLNFMKLEGCRIFYSEMLFENLLKPYFLKNKGIFACMDETGFQQIDKMTLEQFLSLDMILLDEISLEIIIELIKFHPSIKITILNTKEYLKILELYQTYFKIILNLNLINHLINISKTLLPKDNLESLTMINTSIPKLEYFFFEKMGEFLNLDNICRRLSSLKDEISLSEVYRSTSSTVMFNEFFEMVSNMLALKNENGNFYLSYAKASSSDDYYSTQNKIKNACYMIHSILNYVPRNYDRGKIINSLIEKLRKTFHIKFEDVNNKVREYITTTTFQESFLLYKTIMALTPSNFVEKNLDLYRIMEVVPQSNSYFKNCTTNFYNNFVTTFQLQQLDLWKLTIIELFNSTETLMDSSLELIKDIKVDKNGFSALLKNESTKNRVRYLNNQYESVMSG